MIVYHGSKTRISKWDVSKHLSGYYPGFYTYSDKEKAIKHGKYVYELKINPYEFYTITNADELKKNAKGAGFNATEGSGWGDVEYLKNQGYEGIKRGVEFIIFYPKQHPLKLTNENAKFSFRQFLEATEVASCPLGKIYGGMPEGGWYKSYTEYEIGAQTIAEAAHCILGSAVKVNRNIKAEKKKPGLLWSGPWGIEKEHFREEIEIIKKVLGEYSRPLYVTSHFNPTYGSKSIENMKIVSPKLEARARKHKDDLFSMKDTYEPELFEIAKLSYDVIITLAKMIYRSVANATDKPTENAFNSPELEIMVNALEGAIKVNYPRP